MPRAPARGLLITLEGGDGAGKSTLAGALARLLEAEGYHVCLTGEPAGRGFNEAAQALLAWAHGRALHPLAEMMLFEARRAVHVAEVIRPALERRQIVLCDRFTDSTLAYQGHGRGIALEAVRACNDIATGGLVPDLTLLLDVPPEAGLLRADPGSKGSPAAGGRDPIGSEGLEFHRRVREGYLELARAEAGRFVIIDARLPAAEVAGLAWEALKRLLQAVGEARQDPSG